MGAPFLIISTWYLCNPPGSAGLVYLSVYAVLFYASFTAVKIPHLSWGTELATDYLERSRVSMYRETFTNAGNLLFVVVPLIFLGENPKLHEVLFLQAAAVLLLVPATLFPLARWVRDPVPHEFATTPFFGELADLVKDRVLLRFLIGRFIFATEEGITNTLLVFSFAAGLGLSTRDFFWAIFVLYIASLIVTPLTLRLARYVEKHRLLAAGVGLQGLAYLTVFWLPMRRFDLVVLLWILIGIANTAMTSMPPSILADVIDHGDVISGERRSGVYVAIDNLLFKLGMALGVGISFGLLSYVGFDPATDHHAAADVHNIRLLGFVLPGILCVTAAAIYLTHPITRKGQRKLRERIRERQPDTNLVRVRSG
jgi:Na+/melibiose symporter-like transporter